MWFRFLYISFLFFFFIRILNRYISNRLIVLGPSKLVRIEQIVIFVIINKSGADGRHRFSVLAIV